VENASRVDLGTSLESVFRKGGDDVNGHNQGEWLERRMRRQSGGKTGNEE